MPKPESVVGFVPAVTRPSVPTVTDLYVPAVTPEFTFRSAPGWSSLMGFALIVLLDQAYHVTLTVEDFLKLETVADLARAAGVDA